MLQEQSRLFQRIFFFADAGLILLAWGVAFALRFHGLPALHAAVGGPAWFVPPEVVGFDQYLWLLPAVVLGGMLVFWLSGLYAAERGLHLFRIAWSVAKASVFSFLLAAALLSFYRSLNLSRGFLATFGVLLPVLLIAARTVVYGSLRQRRAVRRVLVVGAGKVGQRLADTLRAYPWATVEVAGFLDDDPAAHPAVVGPVAAAAALLDRFEAEGRPVDDVYLALPLRAAAQIEAVVADLATHAAHVYFVPDLFGFEVLNARVSDLDGLPVLHLIDEVPRRLTWVVKRVFDGAFALGVVVVLAPLFAALAAGVKLSSPGPVFYGQERVSLNGRRFRMLKFRSMPVGAEAASGAVWARPGEQRATRFGAFLRRTSLDELPQFFNVLKGDMSVVGPRPERPVFVEQFRRQVPRYMLKHKVPAGITGWAQVHGWRGDTSLDERIAHDLYYIQHWSLKLDLKIILMTLWRGFAHPNAY